MRSGAASTRRHALVALAITIPWVTARGVHFSIADSYTPVLAAFTVVDDPYLAAKDAEALVVLTEWPEFRTLDWARLATVVSRPIVVDLRNLLDADVLRRAGFAWTGLGKRA